MAAVPAFVAVGAFQSGTGALTVPPPAGIAANDLLVLLVESANQAITTPTGWTQVTNSPQSTGTAAAAGGVRLGVFYKFTAGSESSASVADTGDHTTAIMAAYRGVDTTSPFNATAGSVQASASASWTLPGVTTTGDNCLIVLAIGNDRDLNNSASISSFSNANLNSLSERFDQTVNSSTGGGLALLDGGLLTAGATGTTSVTSAASNTAAFITLALTPIVATLSLTADEGSFTATGGSANTLWGHKGASDAGSFAATGQDATLAYGQVLSADAGSFALTGQSAAFLYAEFFPGNAFADFAINAEAINASVTYGTAYSLAADAGSFVATGQAAALAKGSDVSADAGAYTLVGQSASTLVGRRVAADSASFSLTGQDASLRRAYTLAAATGAFTQAGQAADLLASRVVVASAGTFTASGGDAATLLKRILSAYTGAFTLVGGAGNVAHGYTLSAAAGAFALTGQVANAAYGRIFPAAAGAFALTGGAAATLYGRKLPASAGPYSLTGVDAQLVKVSGVVLPVDAGVFTASGASAILVHGYRMDAQAGDYSASFTGADFYRHLRLGAEAAGYTLAGTSSTLKTGVFVPVPDRTMVLKSDQRAFAVTQDLRDMHESPDPRLFKVPVEDRRFYASDRSI